MAEALLNRLGKGRFRAVSAGCKPSPAVHAKAVQTLIRHGIQPGDPIPQSWNEYSTDRFDLVITTCGDTIDEVYPLFPGRPKHLFWDIPDFTEDSDIKTEAELDSAYEAVFFMLKEQVEELIRQYDSAGAMESLRNFH